MREVTAIDPILLAALAGGALIVLALVGMIVIGFVRGERGRAEAAVRLAQVSETADRLARAQAELTGRLEQTQAGVSQRLDALSNRVGDGLARQTEKTGETLRILHERLALIDAAQKNITALSAQVTSLQDILANKQARGAFGEVQLHDLVIAALPKSAYAFQVTLSSGRRADCVLTLPNPPGRIVIDAKFPLESYVALRAAETQQARVQAGRTFAADVQKHVRDIQERYIVAGETADAALMFLPSEAIYAELHTNFRNVVEDSFRRRVWIVAPTTLWATLNTVRAVLKDVHLREQAQVIEGQLRALADDVGRLDARVGRLQEHFRQAEDDLRQIRTSTDKIVKRAGRVDPAQLGGPNNEAAPEPVKPS